MKLTYEAVLNDPSLLERIRVEAHRERARVFHSMVISPLATLVTSLFQRTRYAARPHFARQG
jgi:hypothetical protein